MFGSEQAAVQTNTVAKHIYRRIGEYRYPLRLRGYLLSRALPEIRPATIWDAGCGKGQTSFYLLRRYPNAQLYGTDIFPTMVEYCRDIAARQGITRAQFETGDLTEATQSEQYDLITCFEVLEHIDDYRTALRNLIRALRPGGYLIIHTPSAGLYTSESFGLRRAFHKPPPVNGHRQKGQYHVRDGFDKDELVNACRDLGVNVELATYTFGALAMHAHTVYEITRSRAWPTLLTFLPLFSLGYVDSNLPHSRGGGILLRLKKPAATATTPTTA